MVMVMVMVGAGGHAGGHAGGNAGGHAGGHAHGGHAHAGHAQSPSACRTSLEHEFENVCFYSLCILVQLTGTWHFSLIATVS